MKRSPYDIPARSLRHLLSRALSVLRLYPLGVAALSLPTGTRMTSTISALVLALIAFVAASGLALHSVRCQHVDEDGTSTLLWAWHRGKLRGWCQRCERFTRGWESPAPQYTRRTSARIVTVEEAAR